MVCVSHSGHRLSSFLHKYIGWTKRCLQRRLAGHSGLLALQNYPLLSGVLFGLLCFKPHLGVLIPVALVAERQWGTIVSAGVTVAVLVVASALLFGTDTWFAFAHNASMHRQILETIPQNWLRMPAVYPAARLMGVGSNWAYVLQVLSGVLAAVAVYFVWSTPTDRKLKGAALVIATFLATPYAWDYDLVALLFASVWFWEAAESSGWRPWERIGIAMLALTPFLCLLVPAILGHVATVLGRLQCGPLIIWFPLALLVLRVRESSARAVPVRSERGDLQSVGALEPGTR